MVYASKNLIEKAKSYVGYLEKASNKDLDDFTANAGSANYTRFCRDYNKYTGSNLYQPSYWCVEFISCCVVESYGLSAAKDLMCGSLWASCTAMRNEFRNHKQYHTEGPMAGDIVVFYNSGRTSLAHCGLVTKVTSSKIYTVEGNTSSGNEVVIDNGGCVAEKEYAINNSRIAGYCRMSLDGCDPTAGIVENENVAQFQQWLNKNYGQGLAIDGSYGKNTKHAAVKAYQTYLNKTYRAGLDVDGYWGPKTSSACHYVERNSRGVPVYIVQGVLYGLGYDPKGFDGKCGPGCVAAIKAFQSKNFPPNEVDGIVGPDTWGQLFK